MSSGGARTGAGRPKGIHTSLSKDSIERMRQRIQTDTIIQRLTNLLNGEAEMPPHAVTAALGLLRKVLPDMAQVEHSGEVLTTKVIRAPDVTKTAAAWTAQHVPAQHTEH